MTESPLHVSPAPTEAEAVAIAAAIEALWPRPTIVERSPRPSPWRFSGRWWSVPLPVRRDRPWR